MSEVEFITNTMPDAKEQHDAILEWCERFGFRGTLSTASSCLAFLLEGLHHDPQKTKQFMDELFKLVMKYSNV